MKCSKKDWALPVLSGLVFIASIVLAALYKNTFIQYQSVLDQYLHFEDILLLNVFTVLNILSVVFWLALFIFSIIRWTRKQSASKKAKAAAMTCAVLFLVMNTVSIALVFNNQVHEVTVLNEIPETVESYVEIQRLFPASTETSSYHEQTNLYKVSDEIPVNYEVQQSDRNHTVRTSCIQFTQMELLSKYYAERAELYAAYQVTELEPAQLAAYGADRGFYYSEAPSMLNVVVCKGSYVYQVSIDGPELAERTRKDTALQQIAALTNV